MEGALSSLRGAVDDQEFLRQTRTLLRILQNILNEPENPKFRTVRAACNFVQKAGVSALLKAVGFNLKGAEYILDEEHDDYLLERKSKIIASRREIGSVMGWDVPSSSLKFSLLKEKGKFGDIFVGRMDDRNVLVKIVQPGCTQEAKCSFDRELEILSKISHPNIVQLLAVTLTSEPTSLILEHIPNCMLDALHSTDMSETELLGYGQQLALAMNYLHQKDILHCDLAARNLLLDRSNKLRLSEFGLSRWDGTLSCRLPPSARHTLNVRWTAPETLKEMIFSKHSEIWSYGVVLYELLTGGSVPYATLSNTEVESKVEEGLRLPQPQGCPEELYHTMQLCWAHRPTDRPHFSDILKLHLNPLAARLASEGEGRPASTPTEDGEHKSLHSKGSKKVKVKEPSYQSVVGKGGGLVRVYTALVCPYQYRVVVVSSRKSSVGEVVTTALAKCGKQDHDAKSHKMVLVSGPTSGSPTRYLDPEDKILSVKSGAPPTSMFVLCVNMPGQAPLEILDTIRQNPAYRSAFSTTTRGYLVRKDGSQGQRSWCVLDGSTLLCYKEEEDEGMKQFESYLDFKGCTVELASKGKTHVFRVTTSGGVGYSFLTSSKDSVLQWVESITSAKTLDPSPLLLHAATGGAVIQAGFVTFQEFAYSEEEEGGAPLRPRKISDVNLSGTFSAVDYGKHWMVLRSSGLIQCIARGTPETIVNLGECRKVKVNNPREMKEGVEYCIEVEGPESKVVLRADIPSDHSDWVLAVEQILRKLDNSKLLQGHRKRESGYVALKRLLLTGGGANGHQRQNGQASQLYCFPRIVDDMEEIYNAPPKPTNPPPPKEREGHRSELLAKAKLPRPECPLPEEEAAASTEVLLPPKDYLPPPLPPRNEAPPPLPPKGGRGMATPTRNHRNSTVSSSCGGSGGSLSDEDDDYIMMQSTLSSTAPSPATTPRSTTPRSRSVSQSCPSTQPITIPNRRPSKRSILLRTDSESSSFANSPSPGHINGSFKNFPPVEGTGMDGSGIFRKASSSSLHRLHSFSNHSLSSSSYNTRQVSVSSINSNSETPPPLPPFRNGEKRSSGYSSPLFYPSPSPNRLPQSNTMGGLSSHVIPTLPPPQDSSRSDGMTVTELQRYNSIGGGECQMGGRLGGRSHHHPISKAGSVPPRKLVNSYVSEGYESNHSSTEDLPQLPTGWERGYCENSCKYFYFNSQTGSSTWSLQDVLSLKSESEGKPGDGWRVARTEEGKTYYYHEGTRETTWHLQDTQA